MNYNFEDVDGKVDKFFCEYVILMLFFFDLFVNGVGVYYNFIIFCENVMGRDEYWFKIVII